MKDKSGIQYDLWQENVGKVREIVDVKDEGKCKLKMVTI